MVDLIGRGYVVQYCISLFRERQEKLLFQSYVGDVLFTISNNLAKAWGGAEVKVRYTELINPEKASEDERTGDEIAADIISRAGLSFGGKEREEPQNG